MSYEKTHGRDQAFPQKFGMDHGWYGLTKREYFAALAMQGILSNSDLLKVIEVMHGADKIDEIVSLEALKSADALIEALNYKNDDTE